MKFNNIKTLVFGAVVLMTATGCGDLDQYNQEKLGNPENMYADYNAVVNPLKSLQRGLQSDYQLYPNLSADMFSGMFSTASQFNGGKNNTTYFMMDGWNNRIIARQQDIFNYSIIIDNAAKNFYPGIDFTGTFAVKKILKVITAARVSDNHGPVVYSKYETPNANGVTDFDSQQEAYQNFINDLTVAITDLQKIQNMPATGNEGDKAALKRADLVYGGNMAQWAKLANSLKLRLAMRMSYADPVKSKQYAEEALASSAGLITDNADNALISVGQSELSFIIYSWGDCLIGAPLMAYMNGYNDPRLPAYAIPAADPSLQGKYIGIRQGIDLLNGKSTYGGFSQPQAKSAAGDYFSGTDGKMKLFTAAETWFLKAEAALRGYAGAGDIQTNYTTGVQQSFGEWGKSANVATYLADTTSTEAPYVDPKNADNNVALGNPQLSTITIAWNNGDTNERKLERIITQKWLSLYPNGPEAWAEQRRTGYPVLFKVRKNDSGGAISTEGMIRRIPFTVDTKTSLYNYQQAAQMLNGADTGGTKLWWDKK
ncbi:SusD/RagB family nutrient-binding outer membrane lipoprotein [Chryseobacterium viscerum]|uniref:SusD/RagB family nutrient-binding outer membrane lipoprotein n=1 Tax=Chryseobacterium viscerum TaxID=1037377 RepID=A0A316WVC4_9FLAO|nr:SusD/RagB family nutrient-binding outer membrane lipoprotein [Chryseobacterium viscerum]KAB1232028.1 SusD/RagB family nutrient-binding outer membrane lipoprotein [Chryseobacterium viscerum]PWN65461.1 SusD/RagB family nutrient-binding outer membrane lipoprotein [Chryseobacterium viscerum]